MQDRDVKLVGGLEVDDRGLKQRLVGAILGPSIVPFIHIRPVEFLAIRFQLIPLEPGMEDVQNVIENLVERELGFGTFCGPFQGRGDIAVEVFARDLFGNLVVDERGRSCELLGCGHEVSLPLGSKCLPERSAPFAATLAGYEDLPTMTSF